MRQLTALLHRPQMSAWDVVDILIVSLLIYEALKLIRGTRAMQMAIGSVLVIVLLYLSQAFPLRTVGWLIQWLEMLGDSDQKLVRPRQIYTGAAERNYVAIERR